MALFFALLMLDFLKANAGESCPLTEIQTTADFSKSIIRTVNIAQLERDPADFCDQAMGLRYLSSKPSVPNLEPITPVKLNTALADGTWRDEVQKRAASEWGVLDSWTKSLIPLEDVRLEALDTNINWPKKDLGRTWDKRLPDALAYLAKKPCEANGPSRAVDLPAMKGSDTYESKIKNSGALTKFACQEFLGFLKIGSCDESFSVVARISSGQAGLTGYELYRKVLNDARYDEGLRLAALKLGKRVMDKSTKGVDLFGDLKSSFKESGASEADSEEMAWNSVGLLATGGPNINWRLDNLASQEGRQQKIFSLKFLSTLLPVLDHRSSHEGHIYSFPPSVSGACNTGKAYHFWYSAYLSRRATIESGNPEASAVGAFQAEKAYHILGRGTQGLENAQRMSESSVYSSASQIVRADLAYASAGAIYGATSALSQKGTLNVDHGLKTLLARGGDGDVGILATIASPFAPEQGKVYKGWTKKFDSNSVFNDMNNKKFRGEVSTHALNFDKNPKTGSCP